MALSRVKTWSSGETLTASDLNAEFNNILNNPVSLVSPLTGAIDLNGQELIFDADADTSITADSDDVLDFKIAGTDGFFIGHGTGNTVGFLHVDPGAFTATATTDIGLLRIGNSNAVTVPSGTTAVAAGIYVEAPNWTATGTITNTASLYIAGAATEGSNDYAVWVDDGAVQIDSTLTVGGAVTLTTDLGVASGGTGASTHTDGGLLIGKGTAAFENTGVLADGPIVVGDGTTNPATLAAFSSSTGTLNVAKGGTGASSLTNGGILLGSGTNAVTAMSVLADGNIVIGDGTTDPVALAAFSSSTGTLKAANGGTGASTLTDGGVLLGSGTNAVTAMSVLADSEMIVGNGSTDPVAESGATLRTSIGVGTGDSPQFTSLTLTGFEYLSMTTGITAGTTQSQAGATALTTQTNRVTASGTDADAVKLPTAVANALVTIINDDAAQTIAVWPNTGDTIDGESANAVDPNTLAAGNSRTYLAYDATNWVTVTNAPTAAFDPDGAVTINNSAADVDFLVKTDNNSSAFTINGGGHSGTGQAAFGGAVDATASWLFDRQAFTHAADTSFSTVRINRTGAVTIPSGTAAIVSSLSVSEPHITATGTVTKAASVYIASVPTEGSSNYALLVEAGNALIAGSVTSSTQVVGNTTGNPDGVVLGKSTNASQTNSNVRTESDKAADNNFTAITCEVDTDGTPNLIFRVGGGGVVTADGSITGCGADYQELFETVSGERYPLGKTIVLVDGKVALAEDNPSLPVMGVTRPSEDEDHRGGVVVGNSAWNHWSKKYNKDVHGVYEREDVEVIEWTENGEKKSKYKKNIPEGKMPSEHTNAIHSVRKLNPAFEKDRDYIPRGYRKEWQAIGIVGQVPILDGQRVDDRWVDMGNLAPGVNKWLIR